LRAWPYAPEIQDNPSLIIGGLRSETARAQENPNGSTGSMPHQAAQREANSFNLK
jgi:hypothetical protein